MALGMGSLLIARPMICSELTERGSHSHPLTVNSRRCLDYNPRTITNTLAGARKRECVEFLKEMHDRAIEIHFCSISFPLLELFGFRNRNTRFVSAPKSRACPPPLSTSTEPIP